MVGPIRRNRQKHVVARVEVGGFKGSKSGMVDASKVAAMEKRLIEMSKIRPEYKLQMEVRDSGTKVGYNPKFAKGYDGIKGFGKKKKGNN